MLVTGVKVPEFSGRRGLELRKPSMLLPQTVEDKRLRWSCLEFPPPLSPLVLRCLSCQDQLQCLSQSCAVVNKREQLGDIATGGPIALNIINSWSDIILILTFRVGCKLSLHLSPGLY